MVADEDEVEAEMAEFCSLFSEGRDHNATRMMAAIQETCFALVC